MALPSGIAQVGDIGAVISLFGQNIVDSSSTIAVPFTSIQNRANISNIARDLKVSMGVDRISAQNLFQVQNESGLNSEPVYGLTNDDRGLIRFVGQWATYNDSYGPRVCGGNNTTDYIEITFYGTALNILMICDATARDIRASVDGGTEGVNIYPGAASSGVISNRNYTSNQVVPVVSGLTLGTHTVKIRSNSVFAFTFNIYGFDVINASTALAINPGSSFVNGMRYSTAAAVSTPHATTFESGTLGSRGGRVVVYQKPDGSIGKAVQPTNASSAYLGAASHTNEEIVRSYFPGEFGSGRIDDWAYNLNTQIPRAFTLEDGTTSLVTNGSQVGPFGGRYGCYFGAGQFIALTFVGTGLDLEFLIGPDAATYGITVDGVSIGNLPYVASSVPTLRIYKIASGLPYGTHTMRISTTAGSPSNIILTRFIVYQPKKPAVPTTANELADYNVMAPYVNLATTGPQNISQGVLRKTNLRELVYSGTWAFGGSITPGTYTNGWDINATSTGAFVQYTFFGTGIEFRGYHGYNGASAAVTVNGLAANLTNFPTANFASWGFAYGGVANSGSITPANNNLTHTATPVAASSFAISNLPLGLHTIRLTMNNATTFEVDGFDVITPIHSVRSNLLSTVQNTLPIGTSSISDNRKLNIIKDQPPKSWSQSIGISGNVTLINSSTFVPMADMILTIKVSGKRPVRLDFGASLYDAASTGNVQLAIFVNGEQRSIGFWHDPTVAGQPNHVQTSATLSLSEGTYTIQGMWKTTGGTATITAIDTARVLAATEV